MLAATQIREILLASPYAETHVKKNEYNQDPELKVKKCLKINFIIRTREFVCGDNLINLNPKI